MANIHDFETGFNYENLPAWARRVMSILTSGRPLEQADINKLHADYTVSDLEIADFMRKFLGRLDLLVQAANAVAEAQEAVAAEQADPATAPEAIVTEAEVVND